MHSTIGILLLLVSSVFVVSGQWNYNNTLDRAIATAFQSISGDLVSLYAEYIGITEEQAAVFVDYTCPNTSYPIRTPGSDLDLFLTRGILSIIIDPSYAPYESQNSTTGRIDGILVAAWKKIGRRLERHYDTNLRVTFTARTYDPEYFLGHIISGEYYTEAAPYVAENWTAILADFGVPQYEGKVLPTCTFDVSPNAVAWKTSSYSSFAQLQAAGVRISYSTSTFGSNTTIVALGFVPVAYSTTAEAFAALQNGQVEAIVEALANLLVVPGYTTTTYSQQLFPQSPGSFVIKVRPDDIVYYTNSTA